MGKTVNIDALIQTAREAWDKADSGAEAARVLAVLPVVKAGVSQAAFVKKSGLSSSTVGRQFQTANLAKKHGLTVAEIREHAGEIVRAHKEKGAPEAMRKSETKSDLFASAARFAAQGRVAKAKQARAARNAGGTGKQSGKVTTVAQDADALRVKVARIAGGKEEIALTPADMESLSKLAVLIAKVQEVDSTPVAKVVRTPRGKVA